MKTKRHFEDIKKDDSSKNLQYVYSESKYSRDYSSSIKHKFSDDLKEKIPSLIKPIL